MVKSIGVGKTKGENNQTGSLFIFQIVPVKRRSNRSTEPIHVAISHRMIFSYSKFNKLPVGSRDRHPQVMLPTVNNMPVSDVLQQLNFFLQQRRVIAALPGWMDTDFIT